MGDIDFILRFLTALGCGLVAGVFLAFSTFVMSALTRLPPANGLAAMQSINITVINVTFMTTLFGTAALCVVIAIRSLMFWQRSGSGYALSAALVYLLGTIALTIVFHVPRNDALATLDPNAAGSAEAWQHYAAVWTAGNHVRMLAALVAMALLILSIAAKTPPDAPAHS